MVLVETVLGTGDGQTRLGAGAGSGIVLTAGEIDGYAIALDDALAIIEQIRAGEETDGVRSAPQHSSASSWPGAAASTMARAEP